MFEDPDIMNEYGLSMNKQERFYAGSVVRALFAFHIFASFSTINFIKKYIAPGKRNYLLDGTFKIVPTPSKLFSQLLIISIEYKNDVSVINLIITVTLHTHFYFYPYLPPHF